MIEIKVCTEGSCNNKGAYNTFKALAQKIVELKLEDKFELSPSGCLKDCNRGGVCVAVNEKTFSVYPETAESFLIELNKSSI